MDKWLFQRESVSSFAVVCKAKLSSLPFTTAGRREFGVRHWLLVEKISCAIVEGPHAARAERIVALAFGLLPRNTYLLILKAVSVGRVGHFGAAGHYWTAVSAKLPDLPMPYCRAASAYRLAGRVDTASAIMQRAFEKFPHDLWTVEEIAMVCDHLTEDAASETISQSATDLANSGTRNEAFAAYATILLGRFAEADRLIANALDRTPGRRDLLEIEALLTERRGDWHRAVLLWTAYCERFLHPQLGIDRLRRAVNNAQATPRIVEETQEPREDVRSLFLNFRSVGDNCEFGLVQRHFGAEPSGLLRWNYVPFHNLLAAFEARFEGVGEPHNTYLEVMQTGEYFSRDRRWDLAMHTFHRKGQIDPEILFEKVCQRASYLRTKFFADLSAPDLIFVFRSNTLSDADILALHGVMRSCGPVRLLAVRPMTEGESPGVVRVLATGCFLGLTRRAGATAGGKIWDIPFDDWLSICRKVDHHAKSDRRMSAAAGARKGLHD